MNTNFLSLIGAIMLFCSLESNAQSSYRIGTLPAISINKSLKKGWSANFKWESRQSYAQNESGEKAVADFEYLLSDFSLIASKKVGLNNSIAGGYLMRIRGNQIIHRAIQQFTIVKRYNGFRLAHRFSTDQTFDPEEKAELRARYRISMEVALNGRTIDPREWYFKLNNEYLNSYQDTEYDLEIRLVPFMGYEFTDDNKLEFGVDYRINSFLNDASQTVVFLTINWFLAI